MKRELKELAETAPQNILQMLTLVVKELPQYYRKFYKENVTLEAVKSGKVHFSNGVIKHLMESETIQMLENMKFIKLHPETRKLTIEDEFVIAMNYRPTSKIHHPKDVVEKIYRRYILDYRSRYASYLEETLRFRGIMSAKVFCNRNASSIYISDGPSETHLREISKIALDAALSGNGTLQLVDSPHRHIILKLNYSPLLDDLARPYEGMDTVNSVTSTLNSML